jgi:hypothetical protein
MRVFRQLLWKRLAIGGMVCLAIAALTSSLTLRTFLGGLVVLSVAGGAAAIAEWRASQKLTELVRAQQTRPT